MQIGSPGSTDGVYLKVTLEVSHSEAVCMLFESEGKFSAELKSEYRTSVLLIVRF
jgi:hypothetical protein